MDEQYFIDLLRHPGNITKDNLDELADVVERFPYFQSGRLVLAKGSKELKVPEAKQRINSASVYATDRTLLKKYILGDIIFLDSRTEENKPQEKPVTAHKPTKKVKSTYQPTKAQKSTAGRKTSAPILKDSGPLPTKPNPLADSILSQRKEYELSTDEAIDELKHYLDELQRSKSRYLEYEKKMDEIEAEEQAVDEAVKKAAIESENTEKTQSETSSNIKSGQQEEAPSEPTEKKSTGEQQILTEVQEPEKEQSTSAKSTDETDAPKASENVTKTRRSSRSVVRKKETQIKQDHEQQKEEQPKEPVKPPSKRSKFKIESHKPKQEDEPKQAHHKEKESSAPRKKRFVLTSGSNKKSEEKKNQ